MYMYVYVDVDVDVYNLTFWSPPKRYITNNVVAEFRNGEQLLGFALTGEEAIKEKMRLQKELPPIMQ